MCRARALSGLRPWPYWQPRRLPARPLGQYAHSGKADVGPFYLRGKWKATPDYIETSGEGDNSVLLRYSASAVGMIMAPGGSEIAGKMEAIIRQDSAPLQEHAATADTQRRAGRSENDDYCVSVDRLRMYALVDNHQPGTHTLELICRSPGLRLYACTFSGMKSQSRERQDPAA